MNNTFNQISSELAINASWWSEIGPLSRGFLLEGGGILIRAEVLMGRDGREVLKQGHTRSGLRLSKHGDVP